MAITVAQVEAILSIQTKGFDAVVTAIQQLSDKFDKSTAQILKSAESIEKKYADIGKAAKQSAKDTKESADASEKAWAKYDKALFDATEAVKTFGAKVTTTINASASIMRPLESAFDAFAAQMERGGLTAQEFADANMRMKSALAAANREMINAVVEQKELTAAQKQSEAETRKQENAMATQNNTLLRAKNQYDALKSAILSNVSNVEKQISLINQLDAAYMKLKAGMTGGALATPEASAMSIGYAGSLNSIRRDANLVGGFKQQLSDLGKFATLAAGPLSGVTARLGALAYIIEDLTPKTAALGVAFLGLGVGWTFSLKGAADFQLSLARVGAAAQMTTAQTADMGGSMIELSKKLMVPTAELNKIAQSAAQAGVTGVQNITAFTEVVAKLTRTTSLTADTAADAILELVNVTKYPIDQLGHLGDIITKVGQSSVGSESKVLELATEVAKAGAAFGFTAPKALAWAGALADTGQNAESAATAVVQSIQKIGKIVLEGGPAFNQLAKFIGMTDEQLKTTFEKDGPAVLKAFLAQLAQANGSFEQMQDLAGAGIINVRSQRVVEAMATALQKLTQHEKVAADANGELDEKFTKLGETALRQLEGIKTNFQAIGITIGNSILGPVSTMISGIREITTATNGWANAFQVLSFVASQFVLLWTVKFSLTKMKELLGLTTVATAELATAQATAARTGAEMATAETAVSTQTTVMATEVGLAARAVGLLGLALKALWPILAVEAIVYAIGKINELQNAAQQAASKARAQGAGAYASEIQSSIAGGGYTSRAEERKLLGLRDNAAGQLLKYRMLQGKDDASTGGYPTGTYDKQITEAQQKLDAYKGALAEYYALAKKATDASVEAAAAITKNGPLVAVSKDTQGALSLLENQINKVKDLKKELDVLHTQGVEAYKSTKISDTASEAAGRKLGGKKSPQQVLADAQESGFFDPSQLKPLQDAISTSNWSAAKLAIADLSKVLADMEGHYKTSAQEAVRSSSKIASASERAENAIIRQFTQSDAALKASMDILNSPDEGSFKMAQASKRATEDVARLRLELSKMTKGDLVEMGKALGINTNNLDAMAKGLYDTETASQAAANGIKLVNEAIADNHRLQLDATKRKDKLAQQSSELGMSDYDKQIAQYAFSASEPYQMENEKNAARIADANLERDAAVAHGDAKAIAAIDATIVKLKGQMHSTQELTKVTKDAGDSFTKFLDKSIEVGRLTATMDTLRDSFVEFGTTAIMNFNSIGEAFASMLKQMAAAILQNQVLGPLSDSLFGQKGGVGGGLIGSAISGLLGGGGGISAPSVDLGGMGGGLDSIIRGGIKFLAGGGPASAGSPYIVGENGPELFVPETSGTVVPNGALTGSSGGGGASVIHIVLEASSEFDARMVNVSGSVANQVVMSYDKSKLPGRISQLTRDPRVR